MTTSPGSTDGRLLRDPMRARRQHHRRSTAQPGRLRVGDQRSHPPEAARHGAPQRFQASPQPRLIDDAGVRLALGSTAIVTVTMAASLAGLAEGYVLGSLLVVTAAISLLLPRAMALFTGLIAWAVCDGFVLHGLGELHFAGPDLRTLAAFTGVALLLSHVARCVRAGRQP